MNEEETKLLNKLIDKCNYWEKKYEEKDREIDIWKDEYSKLNQFFRKRMKEQEEDLKKKVEELKAEIGAYDEIYSDEVFRIIDTIFNDGDVHSEDESLIGNFDLFNEYMHYVNRGGKWN